jgi:hypothetical protein
LRFVFGASIGTPKKGLGSSVGESGGFITRRSAVRLRPQAPKQNAKNKKAFNAVSIYEI